MEDPEAVWTGSTRLLEACEAALVCAADRSKQGVGRRRGVRRLNERKPGAELGSDRVRMKTDGIVQVLHANAGCRPRRLAWHDRPKAGVAWAS
ncbi:hypothetical protein KFK09_021598 [Dendrobium nobile]|uniref:Uncharacterized protein n=1 Tax=Dendrobium nobile TaxID=94219 RepID=A0A8T3AQD6_DENNO|nr:hypothetical protein KFK09_021598 [Dendrobium nobile]